MLNVVWISRCLLFAVFIVSNAIICSVAVWNFFIAQSINHILQIDAFLIVLAAAGLAWVVVITVTGVVRRNSVVTRVWFECFWVGLFFILEFSGAIALSILAPSVMCSTVALVVAAGSCSSTRVLMAFTWICSLALLGYFFLVFVTALVHSHKDRRVWNRAIRHMTLSDVPESTAPPLPSHRPVSQRRSRISIVAPRPHNAAPPALYAFNGYGNDVGIQDSADMGRNQRRTSRHQSTVAPPLPAAVPPVRTVQRAWGSALPMGASLYAQDVQIAMVESNARVQAWRQQQQTVAPRRSSVQKSSTPPPLGDWPRADIMSRPAVKRGKIRSSSLNKQPLPLSQQESYAPLQSSLPTAPATRAKIAMTSRPPTAPPPVSFSQVQQRTRPSGPRSRNTSRDRSRPPPLDLRGINTFGESGL